METQLRDIIHQARELVKQQEQALRNDDDTMEAEMIDFVRYLSEIKMKKSKEMSA